MEDTSKYIATVSSSDTNEITNNAEILINNVKNMFIQGGQSLVYCPLK